MGAFNTVTAKTTCPVCKHVVIFDVQFKYGDTWQHHYELGQNVIWGGNDIGIPNKKKVIVEGIAGPCPNCKTDFIEFDLYIESDLITALKARETTRDQYNPNTYIVVED